jgi:hypothetical protein
MDVVVGVSVGLSVVVPTGFVLVVKGVSVVLTGLELAGITCIGVVDVVTGNKLETALGVVSVF